MKKSLVVTFLVFIFLCSCGPKIETAIAGKARIQRESAEVQKIIEACNADLGRYYASGDIDSVVSIFAEDARQMASNAPTLEGREKIRAFWKQAVSWGRWNFILTTVSVDANGPLAFELGRYQLQFTPGPTAPSGMKASSDSGNYVCYWRLDGDGKWRIVYDIATADAVAAQAQGETGSVEQELIKLINEWADAVVKKDATFLDRILADDYLHTDPNGNVITKAQEIKSGEWVVTSCVIDEIKVRVYGSAAVVTGRATIKEIYKGKDYIVNVRFTDTWINSAGRWQCVAEHSSNIRQKKQSAEQT